MESIDNLTPEQKEVALRALRKNENKSDDKSFVPGNTIEASKRKVIVLSQIPGSVGLSYSTVKDDLIRRIELGKGGDNSE